MPTTDNPLDNEIQAIIDLLAPLGPIVAKKLFGAWGLYVEDQILGLVHNKIIYFRTSEKTAEKYTIVGSKPYLYCRSDGRTTVTHFFEVPAEILADQDLACAWAFEAAAAR